MTIVRDFLQWLATAPSNERAEAAGALARAYLCSDLTADELAPAEGLMLKLLDDPSPPMRRALADVLGRSPAAPAPVIIALASDQPQIAAPIYVAHRLDCRVERRMHGGRQLGLFEQRPQAGSDAVMHKRGHAGKRHSTQLRQGF